MLKMSDKSTRRERLSQPESPRIEDFLNAPITISVMSERDPQGADRESMTVPSVPSELTELYVKSRLGEFEYGAHLLEAGRELSKAADAQRGDRQKLTRRKAAITSQHADERIADLFEVSQTDEYGNPAIELLQWRACLRDGLGKRVVAACVSERESNFSRYQAKTYVVESEPDARRRAANDR